MIDYGFLHVDDGNSEDETNDAKNDGNTGDVWDEEDSYTKGNPWNGSWFSLRMIEFFNKTTLIFW